MLFMVQITVALPGDMAPEKVADINARELKRGGELMDGGKLLRVWRIVGRRANFSLWQAETLEELHANLSSLPLHPWMAIEVTPLIEHPAAVAYKKAKGRLPALPE